jgi:predicted exporter
LQDPSVLGQRLAEVPGARLIDIQAVLTHKYATYRARMTSTLLLGLLAVVLLVWLRHRAVRPMLAACVPSLLSVVGTVALLALCGVELNLLSLVSLLMIVSMGIDYGIFLTEAGAGRGAVDAAQVSVFVAGWTTVLGFGLLALSSQPALFAIGLTTGVGMTLCLLFAMTLVVFFREPPP